jgi:hypothetical protein
VDEDRMKSRESVPLGWGSWPPIYRVRGPGYIQRERERFSRPGGHEPEGGRN